LQISNYLQRSPKTGVYSFRIAVPAALRSVLGKREIKKALKTANLAQARTTAATLYEETLALFSSLRGLDGDKKMSPREAYEEAETWARSNGFDPFKRPDPFNEEDQYDGRDDLADKLIEKVKRGGATDLEKAKLSSLMGSLKAPAPTLSDIVSLYLKETNGVRDREPAHRKSHEQMVRRHERDLLLTLKRDRDVTTINRMDARSFRDWLCTPKSDGRALKPASINKALRIVRAIFNHGIREWELGIANPFLGLNVEQAGDARKDRRPFTAAEWRDYLIITQKMNAEARNCTVLMALTGARTREITGLERRDVELIGETPYINIRPNKTRPRLKTLASERIIPLIGPALEAATVAIKSCKGPDSPVFARYGHPRGSDALSAIQNKHIRQGMKIGDPLLVGYSTRHTLKDRMRNAMIHPDLQNAIMGHSKGQISDGYGSGYWLPRLKEALMHAHGCGPFVQT
jgi:integrase